MRESIVLGLSATGFHNLAYTEWGEPGNPNVLICAHGLTRNSRDFDVFAERMSDRYRVLCPDIVGRGKSGWLTNKADYGYPQYLADANALIARSGAAQVDWVGTSMGGILGMLLAAMPNSPLRRLVVNDVGTFIPKAALDRIGQYVGKESHFANYEEFARHIREISAPFALKTDAQWDSIIRSMAAFAPDGSVQTNYDPGIAEPFRTQTAGDVDLSPWWQAIRCPVLVTRGAESDLLLAQTFAKMKEKPGVEGIEFPGVGHAPMFMDEEQIAPVREFLLR